MSFKPFSPEQFADLDARFGVLYPYTPAPRPRPSYLPPLAGDAAAFPPDPPYSLVFRACVGGEWDNIMGQANDPKQKARAPRNLALATIVGVSLDGVVTIVDTANTDTRQAQKPVREAFEALLRRPGCVGIPEAVADALAEHNGVVGDAAEKG